jgi:hypothetical protein
MNPITPAESLNLVSQVCDQAPMTGPQRRLIDQALSTLAQALKLPAPAAPAQPAPPPRAK